MKTFSLAEANRLLPEVDAALARIKTSLDRLRIVRDQLTDLRIIWDDKIDSPDCPDHAEYQTFHTEFVALETALGRETMRLRDLGVEIKDPDHGLVDFWTRRGEDLVYLCWRRGEPSIGYWHAADSGFGGRKPIGTL